MRRFHAVILGTAIVAGGLGSSGPLAQQKSAQQKPAQQQSSATTVVVYKSPT